MYKVNFACLFLGYLNRNSHAHEHFTCTGTLPVPVHRYRGILRSLLVIFRIDNQVDDDDASQPRQTEPRVSFSAGKTKFKQCGFLDRRRLFFFAKIVILLQSCYGIQRPP